MLLLFVYIDINTFSFVYYLFLTSIRQYATLSLIPGVLKLTEPCLTQRLYELQRSGQLWMMILECFAVFSFIIFGFIGQELQKKLWHYKPPPPPKKTSHDKVLTFRWEYLVKLRKLWYSILYVFLDG